MAEDPTLQRRKRVQAVGGVFVGGRQDAFGDTSTLLRRIGSNGSGILARHIVDDLWINTSYLLVPRANTLAIADNAGLKIPTWESGTILGVYLLVNTAPTGADLVIDVNLNGTAIHTVANRPRILAGSTRGYLAFSDLSTTAFAKGDYWSLDIIQPGSTVAGAGLTVSVGCEVRVHKGDARPRT